MSAYVGKGTTLYVGDGVDYDSTVTWTEIGCAYDFSGGGTEAEVITGEPCSTEDYSPKVFGPKNALPITFTIRYTAAGETTIKDLVGVKRGFYLDINGGGELRFAGGVSNYDNDFPNRGISTMSVTVEIDGEVTFVETS